MTYLIELREIHNNTWNHLTLSRRICLGSFQTLLAKCVKFYILIYMYKKYLTFNNLQWLIYPVTKPNENFCSIVFCNVRRILEAS